MGTASNFADSLVSGGNQQDQSRNWRLSPFFSSLLVAQSGRPSADHMPPHHYD
jgi:hypothetical protein